MTTVEVLRWVSNAAFLLASLAALRLWLRHRSMATTWLLVTFGAFAAIIALDWLPESVTDNTAVSAVLVLVLLATPYTLYRFADAIVAGSDAWRRLALVATLVVMGSLLLVLPLPEQGEDWRGVQLLWLVALLVVWAGLNVGAGWMLVGGSLGEPGVVRNRLRVLAAAAIGLGLYIPFSVAVSLTAADAGAASAEVEPETSGVQAATQAIAAGLGLLFLIGFAPPNLLRAAWRERDERRLYEAAVGLMGAQRPDDVAAVVVPGARALMGAPSVTMRSGSGRVMAHAGADAEQLRSVREIRHRTIGGTDLEIVVAPTMPIFGSDEAQHLDRLALLGELALDRVRLLQAERKARDDVERLNDELESFVYTTSHDLKNPVIALIGYLDVLSEDHAIGMDREVRHIFERMQVNARHMDSLIRDLLELSRVGRVDVAPDRVDLELLVDDLARDLRSSNAGVQVQRGELPTLWFNATRARQLFSNLFDNAVAYGGRPDLTVTVTAQPLEDGARIVVRDDGRGIEEEHLERVFGVFERLAPDSPGGTGMGLAICRRVVEHAGGTMRAVPSDDGATFHIDLPSTALYVETRPTRLEESAT